MTTGDYPIHITNTEEEQVEPRNTVAPVNLHASAAEGYAVTLPVEMDLTVAPEAANDVQHIESVTGTDSPPASVNGVLLLCTRQSLSSFEAMVRGSSTGAHIDAVPGDISRAYLKLFRKDAINSYIMIFRIILNQRLVISPN